FYYSFDADLTRSMQAQYELWLSQDVRYFSSFDDVVQTGVFRVNCLDCLDRTSIIQWVLCQLAVLQILEDKELLQLLTRMYCHRFSDRSKQEAIDLLCVASNSIRMGVLNTLGNKGAPISFWPTYKYCVNSDLYDSNRSPSWCDRIIFGGVGIDTERNKLVVKAYQTIDDMKISDHRPVFLWCKI
uniref:phosphoinositide 5-phosphatase n=1 Tax=Dermatophagoides pteronyssinus TaxID=6956 RepID=A0A6P6YJN4_DERPT